MDSTHEQLFVNKKNTKVTLQLAPSLRDVPSLRHLVDLSHAISPNMTELLCIEDEGVPYVFLNINNIKLGPFSNLLII